MNINAFIRGLLHSINHAGPCVEKRIIRFKKNSDYRQFRSTLQAAAPEVFHKKIKLIPIIKGFTCKLPASERLATFQGPIWMEKDCRISVHSPVQKTVAVQKKIPWGVRQVRAPETWSVTSGHRIHIGVIDTGVDFKHPDLSHCLTSGINLLNRSALPTDDNGHGTHICGTIAAAGNDGGMIGVAPRARISPIKAFDHNGSAFVSDIIQGIDWCVRNHVDIINMSFGMKTRSKALLGAVLKAYYSGVIIVASSGNDGKLRAIDYPARYPQTISVGATNRQRRIAGFSNRGEFIDIYAPGDKIRSAWLRGKYHEMSGTSMATSHVSGAIALLLSVRPALTPADIKYVIRNTMVPLAGSKAKSGSTGELDAVRMLEMCR